MKKSFDDLFKERLSGFEKQPPKDLKAAVLAANPIQGTNYRFLYLLSALGLLLLSFYPVGKESVLGNNESDIHTPQLYDLASLSTTTHSSEVYKESIQTHSEAALKDINHKKDTSYKPALDYSNERPINLLVNETSKSNSTTNGIRTGKQEEKSQDGKLQYFLSKMKNLGLNAYELDLLPQSLLFYKNKKTVITDPKKKTNSFSPYFNIGTFLNYNRVSPKLEDEIFIEAYEAPVSLSIKRLGINLEVGIHKQWFEKFGTNLGISFNNFNQDYSFSVRSTKPEYLEVNPDSDFFKPVFEEERIEVNKRVSFLGLKTQMLWQIFPNINDVLFTSFEYQYLVGDTPQFEYDGTDYKLIQSSQYLVELGFRKAILKRKVGAIYLMPSLRYSMNKSSSNQILSVKPFSAGLTLSYGFK